MDERILANKLGALATVLGDRLIGVGEPRSPTAMAIVLTLHHWQPLTTSAVARLLQVSQPNAVRVIDGLVRDGLVVRGEKRRREVALRLTDQGVEEAIRLQDDRLEQVVQVLDRLDPHETATLGVLLDKMLTTATCGRQSARKTCRFCAHDICVGEACPVGTRATEIDGELERPTHDPQP
jgi:DNA-binding MarR family transcriptional regulator